MVEDYVRMVLDDRHLSKRLKQMRHQLAEAAAERFDTLELHAARNTVGDVGTTVSTAAENRREGVWQVAAAGFKRTEQALRTLEEYSKLFDTTFSAVCEKNRYALYTLEKAVDLSRVSQQQIAQRCLYFLLDRCASHDEYLSTIAMIREVAGTVIQLRDKTLSDNQLYEYAQQLVRETRQHDTLVIVNDRPDIAVAVGADGVHLGQDDLPVAAARKIVGPRKLIGVSTHNIDQARQAVLDGANYLGAGPTFPSTTKQFEEFPGLDYLREVAAEISLPTFAIGGIQLSNLEQVLATGITRVAVASAISSADNPQHAAVEINAKLDAARAESNRTPAAASDGEL